MNKDFITDKQAISMVVLFICGSTLVIGTGGNVGSDLWISIVLATLVSFIAVIVYSRIISICDKKNLLDIYEYAFGNIIGEFIYIIYIWFCMHLSFLVLINFSDFISIVGLPYTPKIIVMIVIMLLVCFGVKAGIDVLGRWSLLFVIVLIFLVYSTYLLLVPKMDITHLQPIFDNGKNVILKGTFSSFTFPFAETVVFMLIFDSLKNNNNYYKVYIIGLLIGVVIIFTTSVSNVLVLGQNIYLRSFFPSYVAASMVNVGNFIWRIEITISICFFIGGFLKLSICMLGCCKGLAIIFSCKDYRFLVTPIGIIIIILASTSYENMKEMADWAFNIYLYYALLFQVILPVITLILLEIKLKTKKI